MPHTEEIKMIIQVIYSLLILFISGVLGGYAGYRLEAPSIVTGALSMLFAVILQKYLFGIP